MVERYYVIAPDDNAVQDFGTKSEAEKYITRYLDDSYASLEEWYVIKGVELEINANSVNIVEE